MLEEQVYGYCPCTVELITTFSTEPPDMNKKVPNHPDSDFDDAELTKASVQATKQ